MEAIHAPIYDYPAYYDLIFGAEWKPEFDFLRACFAKHGPAKLRKVFEPACGTGRLLYKLGQAGFDVGGLDLNPKAVEYCNRRLEKLGVSGRAFVADMCDFRLPKPVDGAFNLINSFRHLPNDKAAENHLRAMAAALVKGGVYLLGLHLTPRSPDYEGHERWNAKRGTLAVASHLWTIEIDFRKRLERVGMTFDVTTPTRKFRLVDELAFRTFTWRQFRGLLERVPELALEATYDFGLNVDAPITVDADTQDVVFVLKKK